MKKYIVKLAKEERASASLCGRNEQAVDQRNPCAITDAVG